MPRHQSDWLTQYAFTSFWIQWKHFLHDSQLMWRRQKNRSREQLKFVQQYLRLCWWWRMARIKTIFLVQKQDHDSKCERSRLLGLALGYRWGFCRQNCDLHRHKNWPVLSLRCNSAKDWLRRQSCLVQLHSCHFLVRAFFCYKGQASWPNFIHVWIIAIRSSLTNSRWEHWRNRLHQRQLDLNSKHPKDILHCAEHHGNLRILWWIGHRNRRLGQIPTFRVLGFQLWDGGTQISLFLQGQEQRRAGASYAEWQWWRRWRGESSRRPAAIDQHFKESQANRAHLLALIPVKVQVDLLQLLLSSGQQKVSSWEAKASGKSGTRKRVSLRRSWPLEYCATSTPIQVPRKGQHEDALAPRRKFQPKIHHRQGKS